MKKHILLTILMMAGLVSGCASVNMKSGLELQDLSKIPVPRSGGPQLGLDYRDEDFRKILQNSGYFSSVDMGIGIKRELVVDARWGERKRVTGLTSLNAVLGLFTVGIIPVAIPYDKSFTIEIKDRSGKVLSDKRYRFKHSNYVSIWPHVYLLGATGDRVRRTQYAQMTSHIIKDMNELGLISK